MPAVLVVLLRQLVIALVQTAIFIGLQKAIESLIDKIQKHHREVNGLSDEDAKLATENIFVQILIYAGVTLALVRSRIPLKLADKMGLSTRGLTTRKLSPEGEAKLKGKTELPKGSGKMDISAASEAAEVVATSRGLSLAKVNTLFNILLKFITIPTAVFFAAAQYIDFANWQGPYQKTFQKLLAVVGIHPDTPLPKSSAISDDVWKRIYTVVETLKPSGISMPYGGVDRPYSRQALVDVVNEVASNIIANGGDATFKNVMGVVLPLLQRPTNFEALDGIPDKAAPASVGGGSSTASGTGFSASTLALQKALNAKGAGLVEDGIYGPKTQAAVAKYGISTASQVPTTVKVFSGIISQGVVGEGLVFTPRQDDLIENASELQAAAANNLAPFLASLPAKVTYEIKVVSSVTGANGFRQTGTTQQVQVGTYKNGTPKYKTVTNKFATLTLYILTDRGTRTKLTTIVLGPVDSAQFTLSASELVTLAQQLPKVVTTNSTDDISKIVSNTPTVVAPIPQGTLGAQMKALGIMFISGNDEQPGVYLFTPAHTTDGASYPRFVNRITNPENLSIYGITPDMLTPLDSLPRIPTGNVTQTFLYGSNFGANITAEDVLKFIAAAGFMLGTVPVVAGESTSKNKPGADAKTLSEWYQAQGQQLPSLEDRAAAYQQLGLGQASYYTGTAEQNTRLLAALIAQ